MGKILYAEKIREMSDVERIQSLNNLKEELMMLYSMQTGGGLADNPAKAKVLKKQIARIKTITNEKKRKK